MPTPTRLWCGGIETDWWGGGVVECVVGHTQRTKCVLGEGWNHHHKQYERSGWLFVMKSGGLSSELNSFSFTHQLF